MKRKIKTNNPSDDMLPEYDFSGKDIAHGKYYRDLQKGYTVRIHNEGGTTTVQRYDPTVTLDPDVATYFPDSESVNAALRALIALAPKKQTAEEKAKYGIRKKTRPKKTAKPSRLGKIAARMEKNFKEQNVSLEDLLGQLDEERKTYNREKYPSKK